MLNLSIFNNVKQSSKVDEVLRLNWQDIVQLLTAYPYVSNTKDNVPLFSAATFFDGDRTKPVIVTQLIQDFDDGTDYFTIKEIYKDYEFVAYSSYSHSTDHHKFRIVLPLLTSVTSEEYPQLWKIFSDKVNNVNDQHPKNANAIFFFPSCPISRIDQAFSDHNIGKIINPKDYNLTPPIVQSMFTPILCTRPITLPAPCCDGQRTEMLVKFARSLVGCYQQSEANAIAYCEEWDKTNTPPMNDHKKIATTVKQMLKYAKAKGEQ